MPGKNPQLNAGLAHKQLLIAESEMHRAMLAQDGQVIADEVRNVARKAAHVYHLAATAASAVSAVTSFLPDKSKEQPEGKRSFFQTLLHGVKTGASMWAAFKNGRE